MNDKPKEDIKSVQDRLGDGECICGVNGLGEKTKSWYYRKPECPIHGGTSGKTMVSDVETKFSAPAQDDNDVINDGLDEMYGKDRDEIHYGNLNDAHADCGNDCEFKQNGDKPLWKLKYEQMCRLLEIEEHFDSCVHQYITTMSCDCLKLHEAMRSIFRNMESSIESRTAERTLVEAREMVEKHSIRPFFDVTPGPKNYVRGFLKGREKGYLDACDDIAHALTKKK